MQYCHKEASMTVTVTTIPVDKLTRFMGLTASTTPGLIAAVRQGLPFDVFTTLQATLEVSAPTLSELIGVPVRTLNRRKHDKHFKPEESDSLVRIARVLSRVLDFFEDKAEAIHWLKSPETAFDEATPLSLLDTEVGAQEVLRLLGQLEHGVFP
jgi:putative toxin-antitoxin system antitoxin component (TIGR02293 family)